MSIENGVVLFGEIVTALLLDSLVGECSRFHPLVGFGSLSQAFEDLLHNQSSAGSLKLRGTAALILAVLPVVALVALIDFVLGHNAILHFAFDSFVLYFTIGRRSLRQHAEQVFQAVQINDLAQARNYVGRIVSRDVSDLTESQVCKAAIESVLENGSDGIFASLFWFALLGAPGAILHRLVNTLDAMWGYRNARYIYFGWAAAKFDDFLNYVPARLTAISYALAGDFTRAIICWRKQGNRWYSPNAGPVMASGAGALAVSLGGSAQYGGVTKDRPVLGDGPAPTAHGIREALLLIDRALLIWLICFVLSVSPAVLAYVL